jgi:hypothetical protein
MQKDRALAAWADAWKEGENMFKDVHFHIETETRRQPRDNGV